MVWRVRRSPLLLTLLAMMTTGCDADARADCFAPGTELPSRKTTLTDYRLGASGRDLAQALFDGRLDRAEQLLRADPVLARRRVGT